MAKITDEALNDLIKYTKRQLSFEKNVLEDQESSETTLIVSPRTTYRNQQIYEALCELKELRVIEQLFYESMAILREIFDAPDTKHFCRANDRLVDGVISLVADWRSQRESIEVALIALKNIDNVDPDRLETKLILQQTLKGQQ